MIPSRVLSPSVRACACVILLVAGLDDSAIIHRMGVVYVSTSLFKLLFFCAFFTWKRAQFFLCTFGVMKAPPHVPVQ